MIERAETILNVDDTEAIRYAKTRTLRRAGFTVVEAGTGAEALRLVAEARPDLAVLDVKLPDISGLEVCKAIKRDFPGTLVLQASASFVEASDRVRGLDSGADSYLTEPVHPEELVAAVRALLRLRRAEKALRESDARVRSILETVPDAMVVIDQRGTVESFSTGAVSLFGYAAEEAVGQSVGMLTPSLEREWYDGSFARDAATGERKVIRTDHVVVGRRKDGSTFPMELAVGEVRADGRRLFTGFMRDLTERRAVEARLQELRAELLHVSRLSAAGEMASALAHELNQPLTAAVSAINAAQRMLASPPPDGSAAEIHEAIGLAAVQALRAGRIVRRLRDFVARGGEVDKRLEDLARLAEEAGTLALVDAPERGVRVAFHCEPGLPPVLVDRIQVQQVLFNLMRNAVEAMTEVEDAVSGAAAAPRCRELVLATRFSGPETVEVAVADSGPGLAPEVAGRLFDPFVSTKPGGMGMGLAICRSIVEAHGGRLWAEPNPGGGAVFRFTLPVAAPKAAAR